METGSHTTPSGTVLGTLKSIAELVSADGHQLASFPTANLKDATHYGYFLGVEKTPQNLLFGNTIIISFLLQPVIFYTVWFLRSSLTKNRKGLAWVLTFFCATVLFVTTLFEFGYLRTTLWSLLGWEQQGSDAATTTVFTHWVPTFHEWVFQLGTSTNGSSSSTSTVTFSTLPLYLTDLESARHLLLSPQLYKDLAGEYLRWFITLPIFSLSPLKPTHVYSVTAPYYLGGGGRLLFSLENFPRESWFSSVMCGYFTGYCAGDLLLGQIHYREHVGLTSGWVHHILYSWLTYQCAKHNLLSEFLIAGGPLELPTMFLAAGFIFPYLREDFWFPTSFLLVRIFYVAFMWHEVHFNFPTPTGGSGIYFAALMLHVNWLSRIDRYCDFGYNFQK
ncbi:hypothetical protein BC939DRAFT_477854 [Gamsiella multidivaricata]|uniref:uncharacterized protein n=1 Tax=Gamsiella multidivaricata TaxID=101098 RepID=UPI00221F8002|nr:uncharacterized protein BC939DRAFT_477854 [Gamsiella multidivaricata]KAI7822398.1 hypothetical protein BC939DRAFT_477854 [Gamsiella multidivaricata]